MDADELAEVPSFSTGATFFDANAQAHHIPLSAFGDLTDNAKESGASQLKIDIEDQSEKHLTITLTDNGCGMTEHKLRTGIGGIAHSDKGHRSEDHYGMGAKTAMARLSANSLVFSKVAQMRTVALLSTTLSRELGSLELKVPMVSWAASGARLLRETTADAPLSHAQREKSLELLLGHTPFRTAAELLAQFDQIPGSSGTRLVLYESKRAQYDASEERDIRIQTDSAADGEEGGSAAAAAAAEPYAPPHQRSLRAYLEVLYYADESTPRDERMALWLRGCYVPPRDWSAYLHHWPRGQRAFSYVPRGLDAQQYGATTLFGTAQPLEELIRVLTHRSGGKDSEEIKEKKREIEGYTGVFYYNHDRLISLERLPKQTEATQGNKMMTTEKRLTLFGTAVLGVCREGFLTPEHNKTRYAAKAYEPNIYARPQLPSFQQLHSHWV